MSRSEVADARERAAAIDPTRSFMVQAPAGSGKTELLTQRMLAVLATVERPESALAITFTRKAAREMRRRILSSLEKARAADPSTDAELPAHEREQRRLARRLLAHDAALGWRLLERPQSLSVSTIDSFCSSAAGHLPGLSGLAGGARVVEQAAPLHREAAWEALRRMQAEDSLRPLLDVLLSAVDADLSKLIEMLADMLEQRAQWLPILGAAASLDAEGLAAARARLEDSLRSAVEAEMQEACAQVADVLGPDGAQSLVAMASTLARDLPLDDLRRGVADCRSLPAFTLEALPLWRALAHFCLAKGKAELRKTFDSRSGYANAEVGRECRRFFATLLEDEERLAPPLALLRDGLPTPVYSEAEWASVRSLLAALPLAADALRRIADERGEMDFTEVALRAERALGDHRGLTDYGLALGGRLRHLLIDEFQDTSEAQLRLLGAITRSWGAEEGCTLFAVGDPMQSIYSFRAAEVRGFLEAARSGAIAEQPVEFLQLSSNFRSQPSLVDWFNQTFSEVLGAGASSREDQMLDRVGYTPATATQASAGGPSVVVQGFAQQEYEQEAAFVVKQAQQALAEAEKNRRLATNKPKGEAKADVAILARSRSHLRQIAVELKRRGVAFRAVEIEELGSRQLARDLESLARALVDPSDRVAWLACLRAPWCGLTLSELQAICRADESSAVETLLEERMDALGEEGRRRSSALLARMRQARAELGRAPVSLLTERLWLSLGGAAALDEAGRADAMAEADAFFSLLSAAEAEGASVVSRRFAELRARLYAPPSSDPSVRLEMMTIHKAKGLEWETVILPALGRKPMEDGKRLLYWRRVEDDLLLAPLRPAHGENTAGATLESFLKRMQRRRQREEDKRLLYVATTRARRRLALTATIARKDGVARRPESASLLARICDHAPQLWAQFVDSLPAVDAANVVAMPQTFAVGDLAASAERPLRRLSEPWSSAPAPLLRWRDDEPSTSEAPGSHRFAWEGETRRLVGSATHSFLQQIARQGVESWDAARVDQSRPSIRALLLQSGVPPASAPTAVDEVCEALRNVLQDERGLWILRRRPTSASEFSISLCEGGVVRHLRVDRTFVDEQGRRWVVDFKTARQGERPLEAFLSEQVERYRDELERYRRALQAMGEAEVFCALYFPLQKAFRQL